MQLVKSVRFLHNNFPKLLANFCKFLKCIKEVKILNIHSPIFLTHFIFPINSQLVELKRTNPKHNWNELT